MIQVVIGGRDYSNRVLDCSININDSWLGKLVANEASIELDNSDDFFTLNTNGQVQNAYSELISDGLTVTIDIDGVRKFTGYVHRFPTLSINKKTVSIKAKDKWKQFERKYCQNKVYLNASFLTVLQDLIQQGGEDLANTNLEDPALTITFWHVNDDKKLTDALTELVKSVGGQLYYDENGILQFKAGFRSAFSTTTKKTFTVSSISDLELRYDGEKYDLVEVKANAKTLSTKLKPIYIGATADDTLTVPINGLPEDANDSYYAQLDKPIWYLDDYANVVFEAPAGVTLDQTTYESNFQDIATNLPSNPYKLTLKITNTTGAEQQVTDFRIYGKEVVDETLIAYYPTTTSNAKYSLESEIITDKVWATALAKWLFEELAVRPEVELPLAKFSDGLSLTIGDKVIISDLNSGLSHRYVIRAITINYGSSKIRLRLKQDRDAFVEPSGIERRSVPPKEAVPGEQIIGSLTGESGIITYDLKQDKLTVGTTVAIGKQVLDDNSDGISINNGKLQIKNSDNSKTLIGASGIRQIYNISLVDQLDSTHGLDIPIYIPQNTDGTSVSSGTARIIVKVEKYRAYAKDTASGGSSAPSTSTVWNSSGDYLNTTTGDPDSVTPQVITSSNSHYHTSGTLDTSPNGSHDHSYYGIPTGSQGLTSTDGSHSHSVNGYTSSSSHTHSIDSADIANSHYHKIDKYWLRHSHTVSIPSHTHGLSYGIYESSATATVTIKKGSTTIGTLTTGNKGDFSNVSVSDGDTISITANNLARVQVYIFVEYYLR